MPVNRKAVFFVYAGLVIATIIAYQPVCKNDFVYFDDDVYVTDNANIKNGFTRQAIAWAFSSGYAENWHPLTWISHILDYRIFGPNPVGHHLTNVLLHIINTLLLFYVLQKMTRAFWPSAFVAYVFALHPLHVESVAWISERKDVLSTLFWLLTMLAYARYVKRPSIARYAGVLLLFSLGLMAKPMIVTLPFVLLLLDYWPLNRPVNSLRSILNLLVEKVPFLVLAGICSMITYNLQTKIETEILPIGLRVSNAVVSYINYIGKIIYPVNLAVFYPYSLGNLPVWKIITSAVLLAAITIVTLLAARRRRYLPVGWLWYLGTLVPVIGIVQVGDQAMADRYTYLPSVGISVMLAWSVAEHVGKTQARRIISVISSVFILAAFLICTRIQIGYWRDSITLFERTLAVTENNYKMEYDLGYELVSRGRLDEGVVHYRRAIEISPVNTHIRYNLANCLRQQGKIDEAIEQYCLTLEYKSDDVDTHNNLAYSLLSQGKFDEAKTHFVEALKINPDLAYSLTGLAWVLATHPNPVLRDPELAVELAERASSLTNNQNKTILDTLAAAREANRAVVAAWAKAIELTGLHNFHKVSDNLYRGAQPTEEGMSQLEKLGIKTIINLRSFHSDRDEIKDAKFNYEHIYMKPWHPEEKEIVRFLKIVTDANLVPVFVHCQHGSDRTGTMCAIYRIAVQNWPKDKAIEEMTKGDFGFHDIWANLIEYIRGLDIEKIKKQAGLNN